jgi:hypothetical protein
MVGSCEHSDGPSGPMQCNELGDKFMSAVKRSKFLD